MGIYSGIRDIERATKILNVLFKNGLGYFIHRYGLRFHLPFSKKIAFHKYKKPDSPEVKLRKSLEELGGAYVKLGQMLSLRPDLVPQQLCNEFAKLQDNVKPFQFSKVKEIIKSELKENEAFFSNVDSDPIGSASIGQVHKAELKGGKKAVVKVQRPGVREKFSADIDIMKYFASMLEKTKAFGRYSPSAIVNEFERYTRNELNYLTEANNIDAFESNLEGINYVKIPRLYRNCTTSRIITTEFIEGKKLSELIASGEKFDRDAVMKSLVNLCLKQVFEKNVFHADLHPGNILVLKGGKIGLLDFGIVGSLSPSLKKEGMKLYVNLVNRDSDGVVMQLARIGKAPYGMDISDFRQDVEDIIEGWHGTELRQVRVTHMLHQLFESCLDHGISMPTSMILLGKALVTVEGTCLMLNPRFNFVKESHKYVQRYMRKRVLSAEGIKTFRKRAEEIGATLSMIPSEALSVLEKIKQGVIKIDVEDTDLKRLALDIDRSSNRLSYALVMASLIVAGAMLMQAGSGPEYMGMSVPAIVLYIIAGFMGTTLLFSIIKEGSIWR